MELLQDIVDERYCSEELVYSGRFNDLPEKTRKNLEVEEEELTDNYVLIYRISACDGISEIRDKIGMVSDEIKILDSANNKVDAEEIVESLETSQKENNTEERYKEVYESMGSMDPSIPRP